MFGNLWGDEPGLGKVWGGVNGQKCWGKVWGLSRDLKTHQGRTIPDVQQRSKSNLSRALGIVAA
jgi:hypothetical protein